MGVSLLFLLISKGFSLAKREPPKSMSRVMLWIIVGMIAWVSIALSMTRGCHPDYHLD